MEVTERLPKGAVEEAQWLDRLLSAKGRDPSWVPRIWRI